MNVILLDFDGVINTVHNNTDEKIEERVKILSKIVNEANSKIVIEASMKDVIDEDTLETDSEWINNLFDLFKKYNNEVVGRTPCVSKRINKFPFYSIWKEDEIRLYLLRHPEIDHYCIIDDDAYPSDLDKVRDHLVKTVYYNKDNPDEEGLLPKYEEEIKEV